MPKASHKSKHGRKEGLADLPTQSDASASAKPSSRPCGGSPPRLHHKPASHSVPSRTEIRWDKVLKKICAKASGHHSSITKGTGVSTSRDTENTPPAAQSDQVSLQDCLVVIQPDCLWGTAVASDPIMPIDTTSMPAPVPVTHETTLVHTSAELGSGEV